MTGDDVKLKDYFDSRLADLEKRIDQARQTMDDRLDGMNEFRKSNEDQSRRSPTREEMTAELDSIKKDIRALNTFKDTFQGVASQKDVSNARLIGYISMGLALISLMLRLIGK